MCACVPAEGPHGYQVEHACGHLWLLLHLGPNPEKAEAFKQRAVKLGVDVSGCVYDDEERNKVSNSQAEKTGVSDVTATAAGGEVESRGG